MSAGAMSTAPTLAGGGGEGTLGIARHKMFAFWGGMWYKSGDMDSTYSAKALALAGELIAVCRARGVRIGTAESCTGEAISAEAVLCLCEGYSVSGCNWLEGLSVNGVTLSVCGCDCYESGGDVFCIHFLFVL